MYLPPRYGPIGSAGIVGFTRGYIPNGKWLLPGETRPHELRLDSGRLGFGPMHAYLDGALVLEFAKPNRKQPVVVSPPGLVDGYEVVVYAESRDNGNRIDVDVFVGGRSLLTGEFLATIPARGAAAGFRSAEYVRTGCLVQATNLIWIVPGIGIWQSIRILGGRPNGRLGAAIVIGGSVAITAPVAYVLNRLLKRPTLSRNQAIAAAVAAYVVVFVGWMVALAIGLVIAGPESGR